MPFYKKNQGLIYRGYKFITKKTKNIVKIGKKWYTIRDENCRGLTLIKIIQYKNQ